MKAAFTFYTENLITSCVIKILGQIRKIIDSGPWISSVVLTDVNNGQERYLTASLIITGNMVSVRVGVWSLQTVHAGT